jgi:hypothetical protein
MIINNPVQTPKMMSRSKIVQNECDSELPENQQYARGYLVDTEYVVSTSKVVFKEPRDIQNDVLICIASNIAINAKLVFLHLWA